MSHFNHLTTTDELTKGVDLAGKVALITGASAGLGIETARSLARCGAQVILAARDRSKLNAVQQQLELELPQAKFSQLIMDLADLDSVKQAGQALLGDVERIDILINNAGIMACPLMRSAQGWELQFATNHLGHFLFTCLIMPALRASGDARIMNLSSTGHKASAIDFDDPNYQHRDYDKWQAYGQAKTANVLFSVELARRLKGQGITANALHPGVIQTELGRHLSEQDIAAFMENTVADAPLVFKTVAQGAATSVWAATSAELQGRSGLYLEDCNIAEPSDNNPLAGFEPHAVDPVAAQKLWQLSEQAVGQSFDFVNNT